MKKKTIVIFTCVNNVAPAGYVEKEWQEVGKIKGTLLPQKDAIIQRESGQKNVTDYSFFYKGKFSGLKKGNETVIDGIDLYITNCLDYGSIKEVALSEDVPNG